MAERAGYYRRLMGVANKSPTSGKDGIYRQDLSTKYPQNLTSEEDVAYRGARGRNLGKAWYAIEQGTTGEREDYLNTLRKDLEVERKRTGRKPVEGWEP